jgi:alanine dehydrogenase
VACYVRGGFEVTVEAGLGAGLGLLDAHYALSGARVEHFPEAYRGKDLIVKIKGPPEGGIALMDPGTTLLTMGHLYCFPERHRALAARGAKLVAMEAITGTGRVSTAHLVGMAAACLAGAGELGSLPRVQHTEAAGADRVCGFLKEMLRRTGQAAQLGPGPSPRPVTSEVLLLVDHVRIRDTNGQVRDVSYEAAEAHAASCPAVEAHLRRPARRIGCLRETGMGGAEYGVDLALHSLGGKPGDLRALVIGYGNVAAGAIEALSDRGVPHIVLGRDQSRPDRLACWLAASDLVINGAGTEGVAPGSASHGYLLPARLVSQTMRPGQVVIDLVGGSAQRHSPVEDIPQTTFLPDIHFQKGGVYFASLWGWAMYHSMAESSRIFSRQVADLLTEDPQYAADIGAFTTRYRSACQIGKG